MRYEPADFHRGLVEHGYVIPSGVNGVWGRGTAFEDIVQAFDDFVMREAKDDGAQVLMYPPVLPREVIEKVGYLDNFPHLVGSVHSFFGGEREARDLAAKAREGADWPAMLSPTQVMLSPAACYPVYPNFSGLLPDGGRLVTLLAWVYRHEPSDEETRLQSFRVREFVRLAQQQDVVDWRDAWLERGLAMLRRLGLDAEPDVASDPFFGRVGKMMAAQQEEQRLKFEILVPVISRAQKTAVCSFNWHQDHFSSAFGIRNADGSQAQTACLGFGIERITLALINTHGFDRAAWPAEVREVLWP